MTLQITVYHSLTACRKFQQKMQRYLLKQCQKLTKFKLAPANKSLKVQSKATRRREYG